MHPDYDPDACHRFAGHLMLSWICWAARGSVRDRLWLLSPDGAYYLALFGLDAQAVRARLVDRWCQAGLYSLTLKRG